MHRCDVQRAAYGTFSCVCRNSANTFLAASPRISRLRTTASWVFVIEELTLPHCCVVEDSVDGIPHMRKIHAVIFQSNFLSGNHLEIQCRIN